MTRIKTICDNCKLILREAQAYYTVEKPHPRRLCKPCMANWIGISEKSL